MGESGFNNEDGNRETWEGTAPPFDPKKPVVVNQSYKSDYQRCYEMFGHGEPRNRAERRAIKRKR